jgi:hypothetical protein
LRVEYSATSLTGTAERAVPGRLWRRRAALRHEGRQGSRLLTAIVHFERNVGWLMMAGAPFAIETDLSALDLPLDVLTGGGGVRQTREGRERVNGLETTRVRVERSTGSGSQFAGHVWATDLGVIARLTGEGARRGQRGRVLVNFHDVKVGPLDPGMFELPRGVQIVRVTGGDVGALLDGMEAAGKLGRR